MRIFLLSIILFFIYGCSIQNIQYNRNKIIEKYSSSYKIFIDDESINFETIYLDKENIKKIVLNKKSKEVRINQIKKVELFELKNLNLDSISSGRILWNSKKNDSIVINGILITDNLKKKIKIDLNAIKSFSILTDNDLNNIFPCKTHDKDFLLITTK